jgi:hypothetical protein
MKSIIKDIAGHNAPLTEEAFIAAYTSQHPKGQDLTEDNIRQALGQYKGLVRRAKRRKAGETKDKHKRHNPETRN